VARPLDGPLRGVQVFGFAALNIAGVSRRFGPAVYGLGKARRERQTLLFHLIRAYRWTRRRKA